jgi:NAD(P)-dependent dehydrogenase (short-subunit alcohol dehydrogenase family)
MSRSAALDNADRDIRINTLCPVARTMIDPDYFDSRPHVDRDSVHPKWVTPIALYLASSDCALNGDTLSAGAGVWARVFTAKTRGVAPTGTEVADVAAAFDAISDTTDFRILRSIQDQYDS